MTPSSLTTRAGSADIHRIIAAFQSAFDALGVAVKPLELEKVSVLVHGAMSGRGRLFHRSEHIFDVAAGTRDPIETLAILFHDVVYVQVDGALPPAVTPLLGRALQIEGTSYRIAALDETEDEVAHLVFQVFGVGAGQTLSPSSGLSELLSALVAGRQLATSLRASQWVQVIACIEATIAFRAEDPTNRGPFDRLAERLLVLRSALLPADGEWDVSTVTAAVHRAVRVANGDVGNFAEPDPAAFLDETWKLLPEINPALQTGSYTIRQYRTALCKMESFLAGLAPERVFHHWRGVPDDATYDEWLTAAARNLDVAVRYLRAKLYTTALLEAIASCTGGDAPLELFTGALRVEGAVVRRIDDFLPPLAQGVDEHGVHPGGAVELRLWRLLAEGRATETSFDLRASPISAYLVVALGEPHMRAGAEAAQGFFAGAVSASAFLRSQLSPALLSLISAASYMAVTRAALLRALADELRANASTSSPPRAPSGAST